MRKFSRAPAGIKHHHAYHGGLLQHVTNLMEIVLRVADRFPMVNASWSAEQIQTHAAVHVGVAVALPDGLITPVVRNADRKPIGQIAAEIRDLAGRAKEKKLKPEEYMGSIVGDLNSRRGRIISMEARGTSQVIRAHVPLGQMFGYATEMRSMTQGRATYTMQFARYEEVPNAIAEEIMAKVAGKPAARAGTR